MISRSHPVRPDVQQPVWRFARNQDRPVALDGINWIIPQLSQVSINNLMGSLKISFNY